MRIALINPRWDFEHSIYFGCREPHLPLEFGYSKTLLESAGHEVILIDGHLYDLREQEIVERCREFAPDMIVVTTAPTYLFWRCAPPELRIPLELCRRLRPLAARLVVVGPHASTTPRATLRKLGADCVVLGECEEVLLEMANGVSPLTSAASRSGDDVVIRGPNRASDMKLLPALHWPDEAIARHHHHHHRFDAEPRGPGAEVEASRGCPYHCTFCAKDNFRNNYRKRPVPVILEEVDALLRQGVEYIYFIDEIFLPDATLLAALAERRAKIGVQTRIDLWNKDAIRALARAGCVSIEAGVESITEAGRAYLDKKCKLSTPELSERLVFAKELVPFVQANLLAVSEDETDAIEAWRNELHAHGVWANKPVPLFPYPGSPEYTRKFGPPDDYAWERAHDFYIRGFESFSDIQEQRPEPLVALETGCHER